MDPAALQRRIEEAKATIAQRIAAKTAAQAQAQQQQQVGVCARA